MEATVLVTQRLTPICVISTLPFVALAFFTLIIATTLTPVQASERQNIRFYKANKQLQTDRIWFTLKKGRLAGCHNFLKKTRVYKAVQFGYSSCTLYSRKGCASGTEVQVTRKKNNLPTTELSEGFSWLPEIAHKPHNRGVKIRSWSCDEKN